MSNAGQCPFCDIPLSEHFDNLRGAMPKDTANGLLVCSEDSQHFSNIAYQAEGSACLFLPCSGVAQRVNAPPIPKGYSPYLICPNCNTRGAVKWNESTGGVQCENCGAQYDEIGRPFIEGRTTKCEITFSNSSDTWTCTNHAPGNEIEGIPAGKPCPICR